MSRAGPGVSRLCRHQGHWKCRKWALFGISWSAASPFRRKRKILIATIERAEFENLSYHCRVTIAAWIEAAQFSYPSSVLTCASGDVSYAELKRPTLDFVQTTDCSEGASEHSEADSCGLEFFRSLADQESVLNKSWQRCQPGTNGYTIPSLTINPLLLKGETYGSTGYSL